MPTLIDTEDNREALKLARDLIQFGEAGREASPEARALLETNAIYLAPMQTVNRKRRWISPDPIDFRKVMDRAMGRAPL